MNYYVFRVISLEYDSMHPQLQFRQQGTRTGRPKRGAMPTISFTAPDLEKDGDYWENVGQNTLRVQLQKNQLNKKVAKNIILFLGDGMSIPTLAATRIYMGGEEKQLTFEKFPYTGLSKVNFYIKLSLDSLWEFLCITIFVCITHFDCIEM